ncbi:ScbA/BarX family gamma-butyrolactone biosynthesis protein [Streptomyces sp. NPDC006482]|uniref:ScbA/BarX family gamma-butyrolactone biosynthesis protein n=1 Tax=Streptomyces sp. NPDC006482 TaxID=3154306 RepID=UPI0033A79BC6
MRVATLIKSNDDSTENVTPDESDLFLQTVPRTYVHRAGVAEVFVTGIQQIGPDHFRLGAQWPRSHSYYGPVARRWHDPMLLAETIRQAQLLIAHQAYDVPMGHQFLSHDATHAIAPEGARLGDRPAHVLLDVRCTDIKRRGKTVSGYVTRIDCLRDGELIGSGSMTVTCLPPNLYRRIRGSACENTPQRNLPEPVAPEAVGRHWGFDVVLGATGVNRTWTLRADPDHPVLFDHPVDHVPGMVLMEAARQASLAVLERPDALAVAMDCVFDQYVEFDKTCVVTATQATPGPGGSHTVAVEFAQGGAIAATINVTAIAS